MRESFVRVIGQLPPTMRVLRLQSGTVEKLRIGGGQGEPLASLATASAWASPAVAAVQGTLAEVRVRPPSFQDDGAGVRGNGHAATLCADEVEPSQAPWLIC